MNREGTAREARNQAAMDLEASIREGMAPEERNLVALGLEGAVPEVMLQGTTDPEETSHKWVS